MGYLPYLGGGPLFGEDYQFDSYFSDGWFNHQPAINSGIFTISTGESRISEPSTVAPGN